MCIFPQLHFASLAYQNIWRCSDVLSAQHSLGQSLQLRNDRKRRN